MHRTALALALTLSLVHAAPAAPSGDSYLILRDGRIVQGPEMAQKEGFVEVLFKAGTVQVPDELVGGLLLADQELTFEPRNEEERAQFEKGYIKVDGRWARIRDLRRDAEKQVREQLEAAQDALEHNEWYKRYSEESKHFRWDYTVPKFVAERYKRAADAYFEIFARDWKVRRDKSKPKLMINFFSNQREFYRTSGAPSGALAYFMFVGDYDLCAFYDRTDADFTEQVLFHEIGHYLHKLIDADFNYPHWPGESLCEYYGGAAWDPEAKRLSVGLIQNGRLATIRSEMANGERVPLRRLITTAGYEDYTWGWSFVHMLLEDPRYAKPFRKFFIGLATDKSVKRTRGSGLNLKNVTGEEVLRYFMECMGLKEESDLRDLEAEWYRYIEELQFDGKGAKVWEAQMARRLGERKRALRLFAEAITEDEASVSAKAHYDYALMLSGGQRIEQLRRAVVKAPLDAMYRYTLGTQLIGNGEEVEGKREVQLALEIEPGLDVYEADIEALLEATGE
ncbi:MAG: hypothetical protein R3F49_16895 [Planctomycetota bacterium]